MSEIQKAWAEKYRPRTIEDLIFPNEHIKHAVEKWYEQGRISENALFYGKPGTGKSSLIKILVKDFIKHQHDVFMLGRKIEDIDALGGWINSAPIKSGFKIVIVEEIDRLSSAAFLGLKEKYMEKYQGQVAFLAATNNIYKVDPAVRSRFNLKINFDDLPVDRVFERVKMILENEGISYDNDQLYAFVKKNIRKGLREIINLVQIGSISGHFDASAVGALAGVGDEAQVVQAVKYLFQILLQSDKNSVEILHKYPMSPQFYDRFGKYYEWIINVLNNYADIDYHYIYQELINDNDLPVNIKNIMIDYYQNHDFKIFKHLHFIAMMGEVFKDIYESKDLP